MIGPADAVVFAAGVVSGAMNTVGGAGGAVALPTLSLLLGQPVVALGTFRVGVVVQSAVAWWGLRGRLRAPEGVQVTRRQVMAMVSLGLLGGLVGAQGAAVTSPLLYRWLVVGSLVAIVGLLARELLGRARAQQITRGVAGGSPSLASTSGAPAAGAPVPPVAEEPVPRVLEILAPPVAETLAPPVAETPALSVAEPPAPPALAASSASSVAPLHVPSAPRSEESLAATRWASPGAWGSLLAAACYGGYLQVGIGFLVLLVLHRRFALPLAGALALRSVVILALNLVAVTFLAAKGLVAWRFGVAMATGSLVGSMVAVRFIRRQGEARLRLAVVALASIAVVVAIFEALYATW